MLFNNPCNCLALDLHVFVAFVVPLLWVGYGFGASFIALFAQLGGDIYIKVASICANLVER
jgi:K(+)-stimulated pyrophosphate-energized sodium pump